MRCLRHGSQIFIRLLKECPVVKQTGEGIDFRIGAVYIGPLKHILKIVPIDGISVAPFFLCRIKRHVRMLVKLQIAGSMHRIKGHSDTAGNSISLKLRHTNAADFFRQTSCLPFRILRRLQIFHEYNKFISANSSDNIILSEKAAKTFTHPAKDLIPCRMTIPVIDLLKEINIHNQKGLNFCPHFFVFGKIFLNALFCIVLIA